MALNTLHQELRARITPDLLRLMVDSYLPFSPTSPVDFDAVMQVVYQGKTNYEMWRPYAWPILSILSKMHPQHPDNAQYGKDHAQGASYPNTQNSSEMAPLNTLPNMLDYLPSPTDPSFQASSLGLQLFLDQAPINTLTGRDKRWVVSYFADLALDLAQRLQSLPPQQSPVSWPAWETKATKDYFVAVRFWLSAPLVHHELAAAAGARYTEETRRFVESEYRVPAPPTDSRVAAADVYAFPKLLDEGPPPGRPLDVPTGFFWLATVMDSHKPVLDRFGRFPRRNRSAGRESTAAEEVWIKE